MEAGWRDGLAKKAGSPDPTEIPKAPIPVVRWDRLGRVREPADRERAQSHTKAVHRRASQKRVEAFIEACDDPAVQGECCKVAALAEQHLGLEGLDCCVYNQIGYWTMMAAGRWRV